MKQTGTVHGLYRASNTTHRYARVLHASDGLPYTARPRTQRASLMINIFAGWLLVGWVVALAMACRDIPQN